MLVARDHGQLVVFRRGEHRVCEPGAVEFRYPPGGAGVVYTNG